MSNIIRFTICALALLAVTGCSYKVGYNSTYLPPAGIVGKHESKVLILMSPQEQAWVYKGNPTSYTGGATTLTVPLGNITKQVALEVFSRHFAQVDNADSMPSDGSYSLVVNPRISHFEYAYNQLKNLGLAITPEVTLDLDVTLYDSQGSKLMEKTYSSGVREGESYMMSGSPHETVNAATHKTLFEHMNAAAEDAIRHLPKK